MWQYYLGLHITYIDCSQVAYIYVNKYHTNQYIDIWHKNYTLVILQSYIVYGIK